MIHLISAGCSKNHWQKLRQYFRRYYSMEGDSSDWKYFKQLNFLIPHLKTINPPSAHNLLVDQVSNSLSLSTSSNEQNDNIDNVLESPIAKNFDQNTNIMLDINNDQMLKIDDEYEMQYIADNDQPIISECESNSVIEANFNNENVKVPHLQIKKSLEKLTSAQEIESNQSLINTKKRKLETVSSSNNQIENERKLYRHDSLFSSIEIVSDMKFAKKSETPVVKPDITTITNSQPFKVLIRDSQPMESQPFLPQSSVPTLHTAHNGFTCLCNNDSDSIFLRSLLDDIKLMSRKNKGLFKIKVQQIIQDILYADDA